VRKVSGLQGNGKIQHCHRGEPTSGRFYVVGVRGGADRDTEGGEEAAGRKGEKGGKRGPDRSVRCGKWLTQIKSRSPSVRVIEKATAGDGGGEKDDWEDPRRKEER